MARTYKPRALVAHIYANHVIEVRVSATNEVLDTFKSIYGYTAYEAVDAFATGWFGAHPKKVRNVWHKTEKVAA